MSEGMNPDTLRRLGVRLAMLFGSQAHGHARPSSDVDVGVVIDGAVPGLMDVRRSHFVEALGVAGEVDLVFLDEADPLLLYEVATSGRPLFERTESDFAEFAFEPSSGTTTLRGYGALNPRRFASGSADGARGRRQAEAGPSPIVPR